MSEINYIYPLADIYTPITGGQIYDNRLLLQLQSSGAIVNVWDDRKLRIAGRRSLAIALLRSGYKLPNDCVVIFNSALFVYFIPLLIYLKLFKRNVRTYCIHHHFRFFEFKGFGRFVRKKLELLCLRLCTAIICPNPYTSDLIKKFLPKKKIVNLRMAFPPSVSKGNYKRGELLFVGTVYVRKGLDYLIHALGKLRAEVNTNFHLKIIGSTDDIEYVNSIKDLIKEYHLGSHVEILGRVSVDELKQAYYDAEWFMLPSLHEGYGMVIAEAMSYGVPVIAFNNSAIPYLVKDNENGLLVSDRNVEELKNAIFKALNDSDFRERMSLGALKTFESLPNLDEFKKDVSNFTKAIIDG